MKLLLVGFLYIVVGVVLFRVKNHVAFLEQEKKTQTISMQNLRNNIHVLKAEWAYLNEPKRLERLAKTYLSDMRPLSTSQIFTKQRSLDHLIDKAMEF